MPSFLPDDKLKFQNPLAWLADKLTKWGLEVFCHRFYGTYRGIVISNADPKGLGRIRFKCAAINMANDEDVPTNYWAWPCLPGLGADAETGQVSGHWFVPDVGSNVYVQFENGDPNLPIWIGGWVTETKIMPELDHAAALRKGIRTRSGHFLRFSDDSSDLHITLAKGDGAGSQAPSFMTMDKDGNVNLFNDKGSFLSLSAQNDEVQLVLTNDDLEVESSVLMSADSVTMSTKGGGFVSIIGKDITLSGDVVTMQCKTFNVKSKDIILGDGAQEPAIRGQKFVMKYALHTHPTSAPGAPTAPTVPPELPNALVNPALSSNVRIL